MKTLPLTSIKIADDRQRQEFDPLELNELRESIEKPAGLLHPIILRQVGEEFWLVAGERRIRAIEDLYALGGTFFHDSLLVPPGEIPYVLLGELDELAREEAEWDENNAREDLTWQEEAAGTAKLLSIRRRQAERTGAPSPTSATLAKEFYDYTGGDGAAKIRQELIVAEHLGDPEVAAAKNVGDAFKLLKKKEAKVRHATLAAQVGLTFTSDLHRALHGDAFEELSKLPDNFFDVILTDPPYGMGADEFGDSGGKAEGAHGYVDDAEVVEDLLTWFPEQTFRITRPAAHLYLFFDIEWFYEWRDALAAAGWSVFRTPLIWHKPLASRAPWPNKGPQRKYELILFAKKGDFETTKMVGDVLTYNSDANLGHSAQKPVDLYVDLLSRSVRPGMKVLDPFMGTGTIFPAANQFQCAATGIERDAASYGIAVRRLEELKAQGSLEGL